MTSSELRIFVPQSRLFSLMGLQSGSKLNSATNRLFPRGQSRFTMSDGKLIGYRIKKGVLGIKEDIDVMLERRPEDRIGLPGAQGSRPWEGPSRILMIVT